LLLQLYNTSTVNLLLHVQCSSFVPVRRRRRSHKEFAIVLFAGVLLVGAVGYLVYAFNPCRGLPYPSTSGQSTAIHWHDLLFIFINGVNETIPTGIGEGDQGPCTQPLHNHADPADGGPNVIHIESPSNSTFTLGDWFRVWSSTPGLRDGPTPVVFNQNQIFNYTVGNGFELRMYVNGQQSGSFGSLQLKNHLIIVIAYGPASSTKWSTYEKISSMPWPLPNL
jgi:hypothetical protein